MPKKSLNWLPQQDKLLRQLKDQQFMHNQKNWKIIANVINLKFSNTKTPKQCRQRYVNHLKFGNYPKVELEWSQNQLEMLYNLYLVHGSAWATLSRFFQNKSQNSIKNKFNNCLKFTVKKIQQKMANNKQPRRKKITIQLLTIMLDLANQIRKIVPSLKMTINENSMIFKLQRNILKLSLLCLSQNIKGDNNQNSQSDNQQLIYDVIKLMRSINSKLRCFGLFKVNNRKNWKITLKNIYTICNFDKVVNQELNLTIQQLKQSSETEQKGSIVQFGSTHNIEQLQVGQQQQQQDINIQTDKDRYNDIDIDKISAQFQCSKQKSILLPLDIQINKIVGINQYSNLNMIGDEYLFDF